MGHCCCTRRMERQPEIRSEARHDCITNTYTMEDTLNCSKTSKLLLAHKPQNISKKYLIEKVPKISMINSTSIPDSLSLWSSLRHDSILSLHDHYENGSSLFYVMEYTKNTKPRALALNACTKLSQTMGLHVLRGTLKGLEYLHSKGILHGNLTHNNITIIETPGKGHSVWKMDEQRVLDTIESERHSEAEIKRHEALMPRVNKFNSNQPSPRGASLASLKLNQVQAQAHTHIKTQTQTNPETQKQTQSRNVHNKKGQNQNSLQQTIPHSANDGAAGNHGGRANRQNLDLEKNGIGFKKSVSHRRVFSSGSCDVTNDQFTKISFIQSDVKICGLNEIATSPQFRQDSCVLTSEQLLYTPPEAIHGEYQLKSDIWSLGVIMYSLLSGQFPFSADSPQKIIRLIQKKKPVFNKDNFKNVSPSLIKLLKLMLDKNVTSRLSAEQVRKFVDLTFPIHK